MSVDGSGRTPPDATEPRPAGSYRRNKKPQNVPFKNLFPNVSFVSSVLLSLSTGAALSLPAQSSFFGRNDPAIFEAVHRSAMFFTWSACANGVALVLAMKIQLLFTSPHFEDFALIHKQYMRWVIGAVGWLALGITASGVALLAEGLKVVDKRAGLVLQFLLLGFGIPILLLWIIVRWPWEGSGSRNEERG